MRVTPWRVEHVTSFSRHPRVMYPQSSVYLGKKEIGAGTAGDIIFLKAVFDLEA